MEVHRSENRPRLFYRTGKLKDGGEIGWSKAESYEDGEHPCVTMNASGVVVEMHATYNDPSAVTERKKFQLWYTVGRIDGDRVRWGKSHQHSTGVDPAVALFDDNQVVEMHKSENTENLYTSTGKVNDDGTITWNKPQKYKHDDTEILGRVPGLACDRGQNRLVEVHEEPSNPDVATTNLISATGILTGSDITWSAPLAFDTGWNPAVAYWDRTAVQTHSGNNRKELWSSLSLVGDRKRWMGERREVLNSKKLWELTLPATHDSGAFRLAGEVFSPHVPAACRHTKAEVPPPLVEPYAIAQSRDIGGQLSHGVRYFDIRLIPEGNDFRAYHDLIGPPVSKMLNQLADFLKDVDCELVILKFSHFCNFSDDDHARLIANIQEKIGPFLFTRFDANAEMILKMTFAELTSGRPLVLIEYHEDLKKSNYLVRNPAAGFWHSLPTTDEASKKDNYPEMKNDQLQKLMEKGGNEKKLFLLSWTLTPTDADSFVNNPSLHAMSKSANRHLGEFCREWASKRIINFLYVDFFEDARAVDLAILING